MRLSKFFWLGLLMLIAVLLLEKWTDIDLIIQNQIYDFDANSWPIDEAKHKKLTVIFYDGLKYFLMSVAICCLISLAASIKCVNLRSYNHFCLMMLLSFIFVPVIIAGAKAYTNVYCPYQLDLYGGRFPFVRILDAYPADFVQPKLGKCFPAGHSTAGFAFLGLFYAFYKPIYRIAGLFCGLTLGWIAGVYQMLRGQHFLSHTVFSMIAALMLVYLLNLLVLYIEKKFTHFLKG